MKDGSCLGVGVGEGDGEGEVVLGDPSELALLGLGVELAGAELGVGPLKLKLVLLIER